jgi:hypothetical protein
MRAWNRITDLRVDLRVRVQVSISIRVAGWGTVFKLAPTGKMTVLYNFTGGNSEGGDPYAGVRDGQGNLYGTTSAGAIGYGTVFKITP